MRSLVSTHESRVKFNKNQIKVEEKYYKLLTECRIRRQLIQSNVELNGEKLPSPVSTFTVYII